MDKGNYRLRISQGRNADKVLQDLLIEDPFIQTRITVTGQGRWDIIKACFWACVDIFRGELIYHVALRAENDDVMREVMNMRFHCTFCRNHWQLKVTPDPRDAGTILEVTYATVERLHAHQEMLHAKEMAERPQVTVGENQQAQSVMAL